MCILLAVPLYSTMDSLIREMFDNRLILYPTPYAILNSFLYLILILIPISVVHELLHGFAYKLFGGRVKYGFTGMYAYTREISGRAISRCYFLIILLLPLTAISFMSLILGRRMGSIIFILNLFGSSGDIYMALLLSRCGIDSGIIDRGYGFDVINYTRRDTYENT